MSSVDKKTILLIEDEAIIALTQKKFLEKYGYNVVTAGSGPAGIDVFRKADNIDLVLMDIDLGHGIDGTETASIILKERAIPLVFLSSHTEPEIVEKTEKITSYGYVVKNSGITVLDASIKMAFKLFNANRAIAESEIKQKALISNISDVIAIVGTDGIIRYESPNIEKLFGWEQDELVGTNGWLTVHPDDYDRIYDAFRRLLEKDQYSEKVEFRFKCKNGEYRWIELTGLNCINDVLINGMLLNYHDITERKTTQERLDDSQKKLETAQDTAKIGFWSLDLKTMNLEWSKGLKTIFELAPGSPSPTFDEFRDFVYDEDKNFVDDNVQKQLKPFDTPEYCYVYRIKTKQGNIKYLDHKGRQILNNQGDVTAIYGSVQDITERKVMEEALRKSEEKFQKIFQSSPDLIILTTIPEGLILTVNDNSEYLSGYKPEEMLGRTTDELNLWVDLSDKERYRVLFKDRSVVYNFETRYRQKSGNIITALLSGTIITVDLKPCFISVIHDITNLKKIEQDLRQREKESRDIIEDAPYGIVIHKNGIIQYVNPAAVKIIRYTNSQEAIGEKLLDRVHPDSRPLVIERIKLQAMDGRILPTVEEKLLRRDGETCYAEVTTVVGTFMGERAVFAFFADITERRLAEAALSDSESKLREAQRIAHIGNWELDICNDRLTWSDEIFSIFELDRSRFGASYEFFLDTIHPEDREAVNNAFENSLETHKQYEITHRLLMPDGRIKHVHEQCETYYDDKGRPVRSVGTVQDITARINIEEEKEKFAERFRQIQKMESLGTLAAGVAHDFNNILAIVLGFTELINLKVETGKFDDIPKHVKGIRTASLRAKDLVKQILTFSRQADTVREPVDIGSVIKESVAFLTALLPASITIKQDIPDSRIVVNADPTQVHQIIMNIFSNAAYAIGDRSGTINIRLEEMAADKNTPDQAGTAPGEKYLRIIISDTGCGISQEVMSRIFDPFFTTKERGSGTGMGLSVVHGIITDMGGIISVSSDPGKGTTFSILLPQLDNDRFRERPVISTISRGQGHILLIDDEEMILITGSGILRQMGYDVTTSECGKKATEIFSENPGKFNCVITDMMMPGMNGLEVSRILKKIRPDIPVILSTGFNPKISLEELGAAGITEMVLKPMVAAEISEAVKRVISGNNSK